jgi:hypothetical protein
MILIYTYICILNAKLREKFVQQSPKVFFRKTRGCADLHVSHLDDVLNVVLLALGGDPSAKEILVSNKSRHLLCD